MKEDSLRSFFISLILCLGLSLTAQQAKAQNDLDESQISKLTGNEITLELNRSNLSELNTKKSPKNKDFGTTFTDETSPKKIVKIKNTSKNDTVIKNVSFDNENFKALYSNELPKTLKPNEEFKLELTFKPEKSSNFEGTLSINLLVNEKETVYKTKFTGKGVKFEDPYPIITVKDDSLLFGEIVEDEEIIRDVVIKNDGESPLKFYSFSLAEENDFTIEKSSCSTIKELSPQESCKIKIGLNGRKEGSATNKLIVSSNNPSYPTKTINMEATIIEKYISLNFTVENETIPETEIGNVEFATISVKNYGNANGTINKISLSDSKNFTIINSEECQKKRNILSIAQDGECYVFVKFEPKKEGDYQTDIIIDSNDTANKSKKITISAKAIAKKVSKIKVEDISVNFDKTPINESKETEFKISNDGGQELLVSKIYINNGNNFSISFNEGDHACQATSTTIAPNDYCTIKLKFEPKENGTFVSDLKINSLDSKNDTLTVKLKGESN